MVDHGALVAAVPGAQACKDLRPRPTSSTSNRQRERRSHEGQHHPRDDREHAAHPRQEAVSRREGLDQVRTIQPRRIDQGSHRAGDDRSGGELGQAEARRHDHRADQRQYRHRPGDGRRGEGLQADPRHAREHVDRAPPADAGLWRELRSHPARKGHEGRDRARAGTGRADRRRWMPQQFENPANIDVHRPHDRAGNPRRFPRYADRRHHHRRRHRRAHHRRRRDAEEGMAEPQGLCGRARRFAGDLRRPARPAPDPGHRRGLHPRQPAHRRDRRRDQGRCRRRQGHGAPLRPRGRDAGRHLFGRDAGGDPQKLPELPDGSRVLGFNYDTGERYLSVPDFLPED